MRRARIATLAARERPDKATEEAARWDVQRVWAWLGEHVVVRRVDKVGRISLLARPLPVGRRWAGQEVTVRLAVLRAMSFFFVLVVTATESVSQSTWTDAISPIEPTSRWLRR